MSLARQPASTHCSTTRQRQPPYQPSHTCQCVGHSLPQVNEGRQGGRLLHSHGQHTIACSQLRSCLHGCSAHSVVAAAQRQHLQERGQ